MKEEILLIAEEKSPMEAVLRAVLNEHELRFERLSPLLVQQASPFSHYSAVIIDLMSLSAETFPEQLAQMHDSGMLLLPIGLSDSKTAWSALAPAALQEVRAYDVSEDWESALPEETRGEEEPPLPSVEKSVVLPQKPPVRFRKQGRAGLRMLLCCGGVLVLAGVGVVISAQWRAEKEARNSRTVSLSNAQLRDAAEKAKRESMEARVDAQTEERKRMEAEASTREEQEKAKLAQEESRQLKEAQDRARENLQALESRLQEAQETAESDKEEIKRLNQQIEEQQKRLSEMERAIAEAALRTPEQPAAPAPEQPAAPAPEQPAAPAPEQPAAPATEQTAPSAGITLLPSADETNASQESSETGGTQEELQPAEPNNNAGESSAEKKDKAPRWSDIFDKSQKEEAEPKKKKNTPEPQKPSHKKNSFGDIIGDR